MSLQFNADRLETVQCIQKGQKITIRFMTHVLYFETLTRLQEFVEKIANRSDIESVCFETEGKNFLLGADVDYFYEAIVAGRQDLIMTYSDLGNDLFDAIEKLPIPTVAKISGAAMGGGVELALACSGRVADKGASFAFPETGLGIFPGWGGIKRLQKKISSPLAKWIIFSGKTVPAPLAAKLKLIDVLTTHDDLNNAAEQLLQQFRNGNLSSTLQTVPQDLLETAVLFEIPLKEILNRTPKSPEEKKIIDALKRQAPVSLSFAERIFDAAKSLEQPLERRFEDTLTWRIYHTPDAETGLGHARIGKMGKPAFSGKLP